MTDRPDSAGERDAPSIQEARAQLEKIVAASTRVQIAQGNRDGVDWKKTGVYKEDVAELHGANNLTKQTALSEKGDVINGRGDQPNRHDILTGSQPDGTAFPADKDMTCKNYSSATEGSVMLGHSDRTGLDDSAPAKSWNSSHPSRGCTQDGLRSTGGDGLLYCFAVR